MSKATVDNGISNRKYLFLESYDWLDKKIILKEYDDYWVVSVMDFFAVRVDRETMKAQDLLFEHVFHLPSDEMIHEYNVQNLIIEVKKHLKDLILKSSERILSEKTMRKLIRIKADE